MHSPKSHWCPPSINQKSGNRGLPGPSFESVFQGQSHQANPNKPTKRVFLPELGCRSNIRWYSLLYNTKQHYLHLLVEQARRVPSKSTESKAHSKRSPGCMMLFRSLRLWDQQKTPRWAPDHCSYRHDNEVDQRKKCKVALQPNRSQETAKSFTKRVQMTLLKALQKIKTFSTRRLESIAEMTKVKTRTGNTVQYNKI